MNESPKETEWHNDKLTSFSKIRTMRKYDLVDLLTISLYNSIIFASVLALGWLVWNYS